MTVDYLLLLFIIFVTREISNSLFKIALLQHQYCYKDILNTSNEFEISLVTYRVFVNSVT